MERRMMPEGLDAFSNGLVKKYTETPAGEAPVDDFSRSLIDKALKTLPAESVPVTGKGEALPDWDAGRQALDSLTDGRATNSKDDPKIARARAEWVKQNPTQAFNIDV